MTTQQQIQSAREQIFSARKPFDDALAALHRADQHCEYLRNQILKLFENLNPEWENGQAVAQWLDAGVFPCISTARQYPDLRIDGRLTDENSLIDFLKENMTKNGPLWEPVQPLK